VERWLIFNDLFKQIRAFRSRKLASLTMNHAQRDSIALDGSGRWLHQRRLRVTRERLAALYPELDGNCFSIGRHSPRGTEIAIRIPLSEPKPNRDE